MKELNEKEWKELQKQVKEIDKKYTNNMEVNVSAANITLDPKNDYSDVLF